MTGDTSAPFCALIGPFAYRVRFLGLTPPGGSRCVVFGIQVDNLAVAAVAVVADGGLDRFVCGSVCGCA